MEAYILKGDRKEVDKGLRENRIRVERGVISFAPVQPETALDEDSVKTLSESHTVLLEERQQLIADRNRLRELTDKVVTIAVEGGQTIPEDVTAGLGEFGIILPKIAETVPESTENVVNDGKTVPESTENVVNDGKTVPETVPNDSDPMEDSKSIDVEEMTEVNLDDVKDAPDADTKEAPAPTPKKTRSKKTAQKKSE